MFFGFAGYTSPNAIYRLDSAGAVTPVRQSEVSFDPARFETEQVFYPSKDGTRIPMFLVHRKGIAKDGKNPTLLYGYGGFNVSITPEFGPALLAWLEMGGIWASANLRGGSEYGDEWHDAGKRAKKQNVFDDFIAAAEYLIAQKYTSTPKLAIFGGSNGGLLVGAVLNQRPDLFGAAMPAVGVMDMLRFHKFTVGALWVDEYGSADNAEDFKIIRAYSPLHNIKPGGHYPAVLITTSDHDDRVVPGHSFKYAATLQAAQPEGRPILIRIETRAGHGAGKPVTKTIDEWADRLAFLARELAM
jgi:prolyl oligopeptidase